MGRNNINANDDTTTLEPERKRQDWRGLLPGVVISIAILAILFYFVDFRKFLENLQKANYALVALGIALSIVWLFVRAAFWRTLLQGKASYRQTFLTITEGYLLNNFLPFRLGEVGRSFLLSRKSSLGFWQVFSTIIIERVMDLAMAALIFLAAVSLVSGSGGQQLKIVLVGILMVIGLAALYLLARYREQALQVFERLSRRVPLAARLGGSILPTFLSGLSILTDGWLFLRAIFWLLLNWTIGYFQYYALLAAFIPQVKPLSALFTLGAAALGFAIPSAPGGVGTYEGATVGALRILGVDQATALAFALTTHLVSYVVNGLFGAYAISREGETLSRLYSELRRLQPQKEKK